MFRVTKDLSRSISKIQGMHVVKKPPLFMNIHTEPVRKEGENSKPVNFNVHVNRNGENCLFEGAALPSGYVFVPSGDHYITRNCRKLTRESGRSVYNIYRNRSRKNPATRIGIYAPSEVFEQVESDFEAFETRISELWWKRLHETYPKMPQADKDNVHRHISSTRNSRGRSAMNGLLTTVYTYVRDRYTSLLRKHARMSAEEIKKAKRKIDKILACWRDEKE